MRARARARVLCVFVCAIVFAWAGRGLRRRESEEEGERKGGGGADRYIYIYREREREREREGARTRACEQMQMRTHDGGREGGRERRSTSGQLLRTYVAYYAIKAPYVVHCAIKTDEAASRDRAHASLINKINIFRYLLINKYMVLRDQDRRSACTAPRDRAH